MKELALMIVITAVIAGANSATKYELMKVCRNKKRRLRMNEIEDIL